MRRLFVFLLSMLLTGCAAVTPTPALSTWNVVLVSNELVVGENRFALALLDGNAVVRNAELTFTFYDLNNPSQPIESGSHEAAYFESPDGLGAIYALNQTFNTAGAWGVALVGTSADGEAIEQRTSFQVKTAGTSLGIGELVPALETRTERDAAGDWSTITSAPEPHAPFYALSLDEALGQHKPLVILFATPAFCSSRLCGPDYDILRGVEARYGDRANFIHIEVYEGMPDPSVLDWRLDPAMNAFGLKSEPWTYIVDADGVVVWRAEGLVGVEEITGVLDGLLEAI